MKRINKQEEQSSMASSSTTSRLSALAPPFTISRHAYQQQQPTELYASLMFDSLSAFHLDDVTECGADSDSHHSASGFTGAEGAITCKGKEVYKDNILTNKGKELADYIFVSSPSTSKDEIVHQSVLLDNSRNPISTEKYVLPDRHTSFPISTLDVPSSMNGNNVKKSSELFDKYESDIDSPCWKGTLASQRSPFIVEVPGIGSMSSPPPQKELESCKSLNPLAPKFIPCKTEGRVDVTIKSVHSKQESVVVSKGREVSLRTSSDVGTQCFGDKPTLGNEYVLCSSSSSGSGHQFNHVTKPMPVEVPAKCKWNSLSRETVGRSVISVKDSAQNVFHSISSQSVEPVWNVPSSAITIPTDHWRKYQDASNSYSGTLINNMLTLSELLLQNVSNDLDALGEEHQVNLQNIVNNLLVCLGRKNEKINSVSDSPHPGTYLYPRTAAHDFSKEPWKKAAGNSHWLGDQNEHKKQNSLSAIYSENDNRLVHSFCSTSDASIRKRNEIQRVVERLMKENHENYEELLCQELLYKNLWLDAEAALCSMKRNAYIARMKAQLDGSMSD